LRKWPGLLECFATHFLPATFALLATRLLMGKYAWKPFFFAYFISFTFHFLKLGVVDGINPLVFVQTGSIAYRWPELVPWSLTSEWSSVAAWLFLASYVVLSAAILQPYLGDVARYLRNSPANVEGRRDIRRAAVNTLLSLHESGKYDRIIVVAHSLGSIVAYDMLRATFARMFREMPIDDAKEFPEFKAINEGTLTREEWRHQSRVLVRKLYDMVMQMRDHEPAPPIGASAPTKRVWLVTDFVTLGSPLTHAHYLLCHGDKGPGSIETQEELIGDFRRRVHEREFPTCRPKKHDDDKVLTYMRGDKHYFHHAALFGLTRWTNLYFKLEEVFWGDPIAGPVGSYDTRIRRPLKENPDNVDTTLVDLFGPDVVDVEVSTQTDGGSEFVTHTAYWSVDRKSLPDRSYGGPDPDPPHIRALKLAINLADLEGNEDPEKFTEIAGIKVIKPPPLPSPAPTASAR